jgi:hypothetical protein
MKPTTCLVLGSCLLLQAVPGQYVRRVAQAAGVTSIPLYHHTQAQELLGLESSSKFASRSIFSDDVVDRSLELALYVNRRTHDLLPADYREDSRSVSEALISIANRYEMDPLFLMAVIKHESRFNPEAVGSHGEIGLMQIKPSTALWLIEQGAIAAESVNELVTTDGEQSYERLREALKDPETNIAFGAAYLARLRNTFKGRGPLYVSAYNMGAVNLKSRLRNGERPRIYSDRILAVYTDLSLDFHNAPQMNGQAAAQISQVSGLASHFAVAGLHGTLGLH